MSFQVEHVEASPAAEAACRRWPVGKHQKDDNCARSLETCLRCRASATHRLMRCSEMSEIGAETEVVRTPCMCSV
jgi:hypothetical protein